MPLELDENLYIGNQEQLTTTNIKKLKVWFFSTFRTDPYFSDQTYYFGRSVNKSKSWYRQHCCWKFNTNWGDNWNIEKIWKWKIINYLLRWKNAIPYFSNNLFNFCSKIRAKRCRKNCNKVKTTSDTGPKSTANIF